VFTKRYGSWIFLAPSLSQVGPEGGKGGTASLALGDGNGDGSAESVVAKAPRMASNCTPSTLSGNALGHNFLTART